MPELQERFSGVNVGSVGGRPLRRGLQSESAGSRECGVGLELAWPGLGWAVYIYIHTLYVMCVCVVDGR